MSSTSSTVASRMVNPGESAAVDGLDTSPSLRTAQPPSRALLRGRGCRTRRPHLVECAEDARAYCTLDEDSARRVLHTRRGLSRRVLHTRRGLSPARTAHSTRWGIGGNGCRPANVGWTDHEHAVRRPLRARWAAVRVHRPAGHRAWGPDVGGRGRARRSGGRGAGSAAYGTRVGLSRPGDAARGTQPAATGGRGARGQPAADRRRGRVRQDARADPPDRVAAREAGRPAGADPGDHVHQQGRCRDA